MTIRRKLASWLCPELASEANRLWSMRAGIEYDRQWLAKEFPEVRAFAERALQMDSSFAGEELPFAPRKWPHDIAQFREQLRSGLAK